VHSKTIIEPRNEKDKESREKITTPRNVYPVRSHNDLLWEEIDLSSPLSMSSLQRDTKGLQEISSNKLTNNKL